MAVTTGEMFFGLSWFGTELQYSHAHSYKHILMQTHPHTQFDICTWEHTKTDT